MINKKDMTVNLENETISIPNYPDMPIKLIYDAYERIQQAKGISEAQLKGIHMGRPSNIPDSFEYYYKEVESNNITAKDAAIKMGISRAKYYRIKDKYEKGEL